MSHQHHGLTTQFSSQGMGWPGRRFIHLPSKWQWEVIKLASMSHDIFQFNICNGEKENAPVKFLGMALALFFEAWKFGGILTMQKKLKLIKDYWIFFVSFFTTARKDEIGTKNCQNYLSVSLVKLHYFQFAFLENCIYKKQKKSIKDQRNFCSNTIFKVFANFVTAHFKIWCSCFFYE